MEELVLTDPIVIPGTTSAKYRVVSLTLNHEAIMLAGGEPMPPGLVLIDVRDNNNVLSHYRYEGQVAQDYIKFLNTANFTVKSMHKRILEKLSADGYLPGTVEGVPDP
jgi:hypothetical protein